MPTPEETVAAAAAAEIAANKAVQDVEAQAQAAIAAAAIPSGESLVHLTPQALARRMREEKEKGRRSALSELDAVAREAGFGSHKEMVTFLGSEKKAKAVVAAPPPDVDDEEVKPKDRKAQAALQREQQAERQRRDRLDAQRARELETAQADAKKARREATRLQRERDAVQAEAQLRGLAATVGILTPDLQDYALLQLKKDMAGKTEEELNSYDERKFFATLKERVPALFTAGAIREVAVPATTGVKPSGTPTGAAAVTTTPSNGVLRDVAKMNPQELRDYLREKGISPNYDVQVNMPSLPNGGRSFGKGPAQA